MLYRRRPYTNKKPPRSYSNFNEVESIFDTDVDSVKGTDDIPFPNERENFTENTDDMRNTHRPFILDFFKNRIHIEEIILLGLIFVLLDEGIDDDFLLIMLIYILLT